MLDRRFIKPRDGLIVHDPDRNGAPLPPHGAGVAWGVFWQRRLDQGDIEKTSEAAVIAGQKAAELEAAGDAPAATDDSARATKVKGTDK